MLKLTILLISFNKWKTPSSWLSLTEFKEVWSEKSSADSKKEDSSWRPWKWCFQVKSISKIIMPTLPTNPSSLHLLSTCQQEVPLLLWFGVEKQPLRLEEWCWAKPIHWNPYLVPLEEISALILAETSSMDQTQSNQPRKKSTFGSSRRISANGSIIPMNASTNDYRKIHKL